MEDAETPSVAVHKEVSSQLETMSRQAGLSPNVDRRADVHVLYFSNDDKIETIEAVIGEFNRKY